MLVVGPGADTPMGERFRPTDCEVFSIYFHILNSDSTILALNVRFYSGQCCCGVLLCTCWACLKSGPRFTHSCTARVSSSSDGISPCIIPHPAVSHYL